MSFGCKRDSNGSSDGTGGDMSTGGVSDSGGSSTGGTTNTGGSDMTGGTTSTGGNTSTGGSDGTGGSMSSDTCDLSHGTKKKEVLKGDIGTRTLTSDKYYQLQGYVYVGDGETLTIEPCTRIEGLPAGGGNPGTLIVSQGGKLMAEGEADKPILFTTTLPEGSRETASWGGVIILGKSRTFKPQPALIEGLTDDPKHYYGGNKDDDNNGSLKYVRIEFGGAIIGTDNEINGLSLGAVGSKTKISYVMVNTTEDDCFEFFGGTVSPDHLICNNQGDDMFDTDEGYKGTLSYLFGRAKDDLSSNPNGFEMDSDPATTAEPRSNDTVQHATLCGSGMSPAATSYGGVLRENLLGSFEDILISGFDYALDARDAFGTPADPDVTLADVLAWDMNIAQFADESGAADNDMGFDEQMWFDMGTGNSEPDPVPFTVADCQKASGPNAKVTGSGLGAFADESDWATGMWVDWAIE